MNWYKQKTGSLIFIGILCFITLSCSEKTKAYQPENIRNAFINFIEIPNEVSKDEIINVKINYMLFNPCWSFYNVEKSWSKDTLYLKVNIQKQEDGMCTEVIVNADKEYEFKINKKGNYFITYLNSQNEEVFLPLKVK